MRRLLPTLLLVAGCQPAASTPPPDRPPVSWSADMQPAADGVNRFAFDLYRQLADKPGNLFVSPFSVSTALAMTAAGANGDTLAEMQKVLHLPADRDAAAAAWGGLGRFYAGGGKPYELSVANALWGQAGHPWRADFLGRLRTHFGSEFNQVDYEKDRDGVVERVNRWAAEQTRGRVRDLLAKQDVPVHERAQLTRLILANAIYFKGRWAEPFPKGATRDAPFFLADGGQTTAPLMHRHDRFPYAEADGVQVLEVPYQGGDLSMVVILPAKPDGLPAVEKRLSADAVAKWLAAARSEDVRAFLPRFRLEAEYRLGEPLKAMGMARAFDPERADLSGMHSATEPLFISTVVHKASCEVTEEGTEAAAATAVVVATPTAAPAVPKEPKVFRADRPFAFLIRDAKRGTILFAGRVAKP